jgi:glucosamine--fructose-6-phosphate aminotransferase (isomerizing)
LPGKVRSALLLDGAMKELAQQLASTQSLLFFGRGYNYATALEAALKVGCSSLDLLSWAVLGP